MIKWIYLTHTWDPKVTSTLVLSGPGNNGNEGVLHILQTPRLEAHLQIQFNVIQRTLHQLVIS